ncbi:hypothetical protein [Prosthecomicrobium sp. N25]|uniref:hypothetical protein n=1 Tax=Prosthecomicrobium sp. N25 TaxID=3129254 RepID=UPI00307832FD
MHISGSSQSGYEVTGLFGDVDSFETAADNLLSRGFDLSDLSVEGARRLVRSGFGEAARVEPCRLPYIQRESLGDAEGGILGASVYVPAMLGAVVVAATGGTVLAAAGAAAIAGGLGAALGTGIAWRMGHRHRARVADDIRRGGLKLCVDAASAEAAASARAVLAECGATGIVLRELEQEPEETPEQRFAPVIEPTRRIPY